MGVLTGLAIFLFLLTAAGTARACTTVLAGKKASATGEVLVGHNEDSVGPYVMRTHIVPPLFRTGTGAEKNPVRFEPDAAELLLPAERPRLFWSEARPYFSDGGASFCDFYMNGHGVVICSDNCGASREDHPELTGGVGYGIRRLTAERAKSAYNAVEVAVGLLKQYGYIGSGRSYHFADKNEIWVLQIVNGKHWAVKRVPDDHVYVNPNHYTIRDPDPGTPGLEELVEYAVRRGWYDPAQGPFDFARAYQAPQNYRAGRNLHRHLRGLEIILGHPVDSEAPLPFSVKPDRKIGIRDIDRVLRCHFEGTPDDVSEGKSPHFMPSRPICAGSTLESVIVQIRDNTDMTLLHRALGHPCLSPRTPWYFGILSVPPEFGGVDPEEALRTHFSVPPEDLDWASGEASRRCSELQTAVEILYEDAAEPVRKGLKAFEDILEEELTRFEAALAQTSGDRGRTGKTSDRLRRLLTGAVNRWTERALNRVESLFLMVRVLPMELPERLDVNDGKTPVVVRLSLQNLAKRLGDDQEDFAPDRIALDRTLFGPGHVAPGSWSKAKSAEVRNENEDGEKSLCLSFEIGDWREDTAPCLTDMWLQLENKEGRRLAGRAFSMLTAFKGEDQGCSACDRA